jgi:hypothetical protein
MYVYVAVISTVVNFEQPRRLFNAKQLCSTTFCQANNTRVSYGVSTQGSA